MYIDTTDGESTYLTLYEAAAGFSEAESICRNINGSLLNANSWFSKEALRQLTAEADIALVWVVTDENRWTWIGMLTWLLSYSKDSAFL